MRLLEVGFEECKSEPYMFTCGEVVCIVYLDDCLFYSPSQQHIDIVFDEMRKTDLGFKIENELAGFLGVKVNHREDGSIELLQTGLIDRVISALGLEEANAKAIPAEHNPLVSDDDGEEQNEHFNYASVVGMLMYLTGSSQPELAFSVHQCARFTHNPKASHEKAPKRIGQYLIGTRTKGLILRPKIDLNVEMFVDADFAG